MFKIIGDDIFFNGETVAKFVNNVTPTVRTKAQDMLEEYPDAADMERELTEEWQAGYDEATLEYEREIERLEDRVAELEEQMDREAA